MKNSTKRFMLFGAGRSRRMDGQWSLRLPTTRLNYLAEAALPCISPIKVKIKSLHNSFSLISDGGVRFKATVNHINPATRQNNEFTNNRRKLLSQKKGMYQFIEYTNDKYLLSVIRFKITIL